MVKIIPSILTLDLKEAEEKLELAEETVDRIQIDIIDGKFANNRTIDPSVFENIETNLKLDFHLMTKEPLDWVERCVRGMADRIIGQIEMMSDQVAFVGKVQEVGSLVGLAIDLETPVSKLDPTILTNLDVVLVMSVTAGFGGQKFDKRAIGKVKELEEIRLRDQTPFKICVDGGVEYSNIKDIAEADADEVVIGNLLFEGKIDENIKKLVSYLATK